VPLRLTRIEREKEKRSMAIHPAINKALLLIFSLSLAAIALTATTQAIAQGGRVDQSLIQPPPPNQGGTCLTGFIVDRYYQPAGAGWGIQITSIEIQSDYQSQPDLSWEGDLHTKIS